MLEVAEQLRAAFEDERREFYGREVEAGGAENHGSEFGVAQTGKGATEAGDNKGEGHRRTGAVGNGIGGSHEQAGADNRTDAEHDQTDRTEGTLQAVLAGFLSL